MGKCDKEFWKEIKKINNDKIVPNVVNNSSGKENISNMWKDHFREIFNSSKEFSMKSVALDKLKLGNKYFDRFLTSDVINAKKALKNGKSCGKDNLHAEHFKYADDKFAVLMSILINAMIVHEFLPVNMLDTIIVPILKR